MAHAQRSASGDARTRRADNTWPEGMFLSVYLYFLADVHGPTRSDGQVDDDLGAFHNLRVDDTSPAAAGNGRGSVHHHHYHITAHSVVINTGHAGHPTITTDPPVTSTGARPPAPSPRRPSDTPVVDGFGTTLRISGDSPRQRRVPGSMGAGQPQASGGSHRQHREHREHREHRPPTSDPSVQGTTDTGGSAAGDYEDWNNRPAPVDPQIGRTY